MNWARITLELLNGVWAIAATSLAIICAFYFQHEARARSYRWQRGWRKFMTSGMKVSTAVGAISAGTAIRASTIFAWHVRGGYTDLTPGYLIVGTVVAVAGFICAVREFSRPIMGQTPWLWTVIVIAIFVLSDLTAHLV